MPISFHHPKPQPEHSPAELALTRRIPPGVTSEIGLVIHLWGQKYIEPATLDEAGIPTSESTDDY